MEEMSDLEGFRVQNDVEVRFRDTDALGHVNNAVYLSYLESGRLAYMREVFAVTDWRKIEFIVARVEIDYRSPSFVGEMLTVGTRVCRLGGASFDMDYRIIDKKKGRLVAQAKTVQVCFDYKANKVKRLSEDFMDTVRRYDAVA